MTLYYYYQTFRVDAGARPWSSCKRNIVIQKICRRSRSSARICWLNILERQEVPTERGCQRQTGECAHRECMKLEMDAYCTAGRVQQVEDDIMRQRMASACPTCKCSSPNRSTSSRRTSASSSSSCRASMSGTRTMRCCLPVYADGSQHVLHSLPRAARH